MIKVLPKTQQSSSPSGLHNILNHLLPWSIASLYIAAVLGVLALAWQTVHTIVSLFIAADSYPAILQLLDPILLLLLLAELLNTLTITLQSHHLPLRPLVALIFVALLRHGVILISTTTLATSNALATLIGIIVFAVLLQKLPARDID